ncbi:MAG TPA: DJ-1/PfpI family protein [Rhodocyclaceae bacterium]|nr:DJ-1/PfpI family protein [Rhodocyclaceae bacterium]
MSDHRTDAPFCIVFAIYPGMTHLDFTGPHQILSQMPNSETIVASVSGGDIDADGLTFGTTRKLGDIPACDLICVPGGLPATRVALDETYLAQLKRLAADARYVTSVCNGSLILGAAGLLKGKRAACHWGFRDLLPLFGAIPDQGRVVRDGNIITGGGVTAGIDFALTVLAEVAGEHVAQTIQLIFEYAPEPPFNAGRLETAPADVAAQCQAMMATLVGQRRAEAEAAAARMSAG